VAHILQDAYLLLLCSPGALLGLICSASSQRALLPSGRAPARGPWGWQDPEACGRKGWLVIVAFCLLEHWFGPLCRQWWNL